MEEINLGLITKLKEQAGIHSDVVSKVLDTVAETIQKDDEMEIYTSGATNIFKYPGTVRQFQGQRADQCF